MKSIRLLLIVATAICIVGCTCQEKQERVVIAYVTSWTHSLPDPAYVTHINYAFGHVNETFNGIRIDNEERLKVIVELKKQKPSLKVLLSVGGWESGGFSEMAATEVNRKAFAANCKKVIEDFGLDGVDIDWEYPTSNVSGISASPKDTDNFTTLMAEIRASIGKHKLLTIATAANGKYIKYSAIKKYVNFVNIMAYDIAEVPKHHAALFRSEMTDTLTCATAISAHVAAGMPIERLVLGIPFYGRSNEELGGFTPYSKIRQLEGYTKQWDQFAKVPYLTNDAGEMVCSYEDANSIRLKCEYINELGLLGAMYWEYDGDDEQQTLQKAVYEGILSQEI